MRDAAAAVSLRPEPRNAAVGQGTALGSVPYWQNFGQAFDSVLTRLKRSIIELAATFLGTQLKNAILSNTDALGDFRRSVRPSMALKHTIIE